MILNWIDQHVEELLQFAARLVATPSPNLPGDERLLEQEQSDLASEFPLLLRESHGQGNCA